MILTARIGLLGAAWLLTERLTFAQATRAVPASGSGSFMGRVEDAQGKPLPGVTVCLCTRSLDIYNAMLPPEHFPVDSALGRPADQDSFYFTTTQADASRSPRVVATPC